MTSEKQWTAIDLASSPGYSPRDNENAFQLNEMGGGLTAIDDRDYSIDEELATFTNGNRSPRTTGRHYSGTGMAGILSNGIKLDEKVRSITI